MLKRTAILLIFLVVTSLTAPIPVSALSSDPGAMQAYGQDGAAEAIPKWVYVDKETLSKPLQKMSTDLRGLVRDEFLPPSVSRGEVQEQMRMLRQFSPGETAVPGVGEVAPADMVYVYISLAGNTATEVVDPYVWRVTDRNEAAGLVVAWVDVTRLSELAALDEVRTIRTVILPDICTGSVTSDGDAVHRADLARDTFAVNGSGIQVGVISDSVDHVADAILTGDIPADVTVVENDYPGDHNDEGIAILEIVHDIAPGAQLYFHDCGGNILAFNNAISALVAAGCDVIVDDIGWKYEPFFEDGLVARHVKDIIDSNDVIYVSSAGNSGRRHYQGAYFKNTAYPDREWHDFSHGGGYPFLYMQLEPGGSVQAVLQWDDPWGGSGNDYNLGLYDMTNEGWVDISINTQDGAGDPLEYVSYMNSGDAAVDYALVVEKAAGEPRELEVYFYVSGPAGIYSNNIVSADSIFGHKAVPGILSVGALDPNNPEQIASYSSQGPITIAYPQPEIRSKPDIAGMAGVMVTGAGGFPVPFYGTSAAAPHVGAIAAMTWSAAPTNTGEEIAQVLLDTAKDLGSPGFDCVFGYGMADAFEAVQLAAPPARTGDLNANGIVDWGDVVKCAYMSWGLIAHDIAAADFNDNGIIDWGDTVKLAYYYWGKIPAL